MGLIVSLALFFVIVIIVNAVDKKYKQYLKRKKGKEILAEAVWRLSPRFVSVEGRFWGQVVVCYLYVYCLKFHKTVSLLELEDWYKMHQGNAKPEVIILLREFFKEIDLAERKLNVRGEYSLRMVRQVLEVALLPNNDYIMEIDY